MGTNCALTVNPSGYFYLNGASNQIGSITMNGGSLYGNSPTNAAIGTLMLRGNIAATYSPLLDSAISAKINLGGVTRTIDVATNAVLFMTGVIDDGLTGITRASAGITKTSAGTLNLLAANTYNGVTTVNGEVLGIYNNAALGTTNIGTTVAAGAQLFLASGVNVSDEPLTLNGVGPNGGGPVSSKRFGEREPGLKPGCTRDAAA